MKLIFKKSFGLIDAGPTLFGDKIVQGRAFAPDGSGRRLVPIGEYNAQQIPNPYDHEMPWIIISGSMIGASVASLTQWGDDGIIVLDDNGNKVPHVE